MEILAELKEGETRNKKEQRKMYKMKKRNVGSSSEMNQDTDLDYWRMIIPDSTWL